LGFEFVGDAGGFFDLLEHLFGVSVVGCGGVDVGEGCVDGGCGDVGEGFGVYPGGLK